MLRARPFKIVFRQHRPEADLYTPPSIDYVVTDTWGNTSTSTRTVIVAAPATPKPAPENAIMAYLANHNVNPKPSSGQSPPQKSSKRSPVRNKRQIRNTRLSQRFEF